MDEPNTNQELLTFFKALADNNRLKIIGLLAQQPCTVEQLAALLHLGASTTSHHLSQLAQVGLVSARTDGHYYIYSLHTEVLQKMTQKILKLDELSKLSEDVDLDAYDRKVLKTFTATDGTITAFPSQEKKFLVLLRYVVRTFEPGRRYTEKEVNEILAGFNPDTAYLRRNLVEYKFMLRQANGAEYWLNEQRPAKETSA